MGWIAVIATERNDYSLLHVTLPSNAWLATSQLQIAVARMQSGLSAMEQGHSQQASVGTAQSPSQNSTEPQLRF